jgi:hypothetical protein
LTKNELVVGRGYSLKIFDLSLSKILVFPTSRDSAQTIFGALITEK